jgi:hypothetical protein
VSLAVIRLDAATVLLQWATGGLAFCWVTTRRQEVGIGYGWLLRTIFGLMAVGAMVCGLLLDPDPVRETGAAAMAIVASAALVVSVVRRRGGAEGLPRWLDLPAPIFGVVGLIGAALGSAVETASDSGAIEQGHDAVALVRTLVGAAFLGAVTDAMLLGHWYLVQPGLPRRLLNELVRLVGLVWPLEVAAMLLPTGMVSVLDGSVSDGWDGTLGWFWLACAATTIVLVLVTRAALRERAYSAVMAATGLLYLAILTAFGTDLVARAVLAG